MRWDRTEDKNVVHGKRVTAVKHCEAAQSCDEESMPPLCPTAAIAQTSQTLKKENANGLACRLLHRR
jgi:hypothetical protein